MEITSMIYLYLYKTKPVLTVIFTEAEVIKNFTNVRHLHSLNSQGESSTKRLKTQQSWCSFFSIPKL